MMMLKKLDLDTKLKLLQLKQDELKRKAFEKGLKRIISAAAEALEESASESTPMSEGKKAGVLTLICDECGSEIKVAPDAKSVICPKCGASYKK
jgi:rubrerythrin